MGDVVLVFCLRFGANVAGMHFRDFIPPPHNSGVFRIALSSCGLVLRLATRWKIEVRQHRTTGTTSTPVC